MGITGLAGLFLLMGLMANNWKLAAIVLGGFAALFVLAFAICVAFIRGAVHFGQWPTWRHALLGLSRRYFLTGLQAASLAVAVMSLLLMLVIKNDLLAAWQANQTSGTPNRFLINIQPDQKEGVARLLKDAMIADVNLYPMVRGRLIEVNGKSITPDDFADDRAQRMVDREFNLSYGQLLPPGNRIVSGTWHGSTEGNQLSLEEGLAKTLGLHLGDQLTFDVAATRVTATVTSIRALDWSSLRVNFFAILTPKTLQSAPQTWITAYHQESAQANLDANLVARYPNLTVVNVDSSLAQVQGVLDKLSKAVEYLFALALVAASLVLMSTLSAMKEERLRDAALFKTLGASVGQVRAQFLTQLLVLGAISGLLASAGAALIAWALAHFVLDIAVTVSWILVPYALMLACGVSLASGYRAWQQVAKVPAVRLLQESV
jgi:putative ABC transport system permease protein